MTKLQALIGQFKNALQRFKEVLAVQKTDIVRDSAIKRFELTLDVSWKLLKTFLEDKYGIICNSPKECFRESFRQGIIEYDDEWIKFVDMRNDTVHTYKEEIAEKIYSQLPNVLKHLEALFAIIEKAL